MKPTRLQIKGFLSYHDPVDIDLTGIDLACISGSNGAGKSSLLDAITWALFGEARRKDDSIINHLTQKEGQPAAVTIDFEYEDVLYRIRRSKQKDKTGTLEFFIQRSGDNWTAITEATMKATDEKICQVLRLDYETFINASFFLQGKADQFAQQRPADRKRILASILGLEVWEKYREETGKRRKTADASLAAIDGALAELNIELNEEDQRKKELADVEFLVKTKKDALGALQKLLDQARVTLAQKESEGVLLQKMYDDLSALNKDLRENDTTYENRKSELDSFNEQIADGPEILEGFTRWEKLKADLDKYNALEMDVTKLQVEKQGPEREISNARVKIETEIESLHANQERASQGEAELQNLISQATGHNKEIQGIDAQMKDKPDLDTLISKAREEMARVQAENQVLRSEMEALEKHIKALKEIDGAQCPTCEKPLTADELQKMIDDLTVQGTAKGDVFRANRDVYTKTETEFNDLEWKKKYYEQLAESRANHERAMQSLADQTERIQKDVTEWKKKGLPRLESLTDALDGLKFAEDARAKLAEVNAKIDALGYDMVTHDNLKIAEEEASQFQDRKNKLDQAKAAVKPLQREIDSLTKAGSDLTKKYYALLEQHTNATEKFNAKYQDTDDLAEIESNFRDGQEELNTLQSKVGYAKNRVDVLDQIKKQKKAREDEKGGILEKITTLKVLEKSFGKDGVPALLTEQSLPEIEGYANEILSQLSAGVMQLYFRTQKEYKDAKREDLKETLDIIITSASDERAYELFSGGEAFRINFAVRMALSRMLASRAGAKLQTLVIDEGFGSQDADGRQRLIEAINCVQDKFARILVITHLEELKDAFPARIEVTKSLTGSQVRLYTA